MRLLNTTDLTSKEFPEHEVPPYAILSHTWGNEEVLFADIVSGSGNSKAAWSKITGASDMAREHGFEWIWIDTCCIDKSSSAELSEAINSMFKWYKASAVCYVYLQDVKPKCTILRSAYYEFADFTSSRWFSRGWTLQELVAPADVRFYAEAWEELGTRRSLVEPISHRTQVPLSVLRGGNPSECSVAERMSWAAGRSTTRAEDMAYCLLGLFGVSMPLLYGEGQAAFRRLQKHILSVEEDYSLLTWVDDGSSSSYEQQGRAGCLAHGPDNFTKMVARELYTNADGHTADSNLTCTRENSSDGTIMDTNDSGYHIASYASLVTKSQLEHGAEVGDPPTVTSRGLRLQLPIRHSSRPYQKSLMFLNCECNGQLVCVEVEPQLGKSGTIYARLFPGLLFLVDRSLAPDFKQQSLYLLYETESARDGSSSGTIRLHPRPRYLTMEIGSRNGPTLRLLYSTIEPRDGRIMKGNFVHRRYDVQVLLVPCIWNASMFEVGHEGHLVWVLIVCGGHEDEPWCIVKYESSYTGAMTLIEILHSTFCYRFKSHEFEPELQYAILAQLGLDTSRDRDAKALSSLICNASIDRRPKDSVFELRVKFGGHSELEPWAQLLLR